MELISYVVSTLLLLLYFTSYNESEANISCFVCASRNNSDPHCDDPYSPDPGDYHERCKIPKRNRQGEFPAHFCIKAKGVSTITGEKIMIRRCVSANMDSQYGHFKIEQEVFKGWFLTCDLDGCNSAPKSNYNFQFIIYAIIGQIPLQINAL